jgi:hypothetical protein
MVILAIATVLFAGPASAQACGWLWGFNYLGPGTSVGPCIWYVNQATCSGWSNWGGLSANQSAGGTTLDGYENNLRIRGRYISGSGFLFIYPSDLGMSGSLIAHGTWWANGSAYIQLCAN